MKGTVVNDRLHRASRHRDRSRAWLGRLYALDLAWRGASVVVNDIGGTMHGEGSDSSVADHVVEEINSQGGIAVASHDSVATAEGGGGHRDKAMEHFGQLDAVVSNAGIFDTAAL